MPRFTLRDLFWLTLVVGMALGWWAHASQLGRTIEKTSDSYYEMFVAVAQLENHIAEEGYRIEWANRHRASRLWNRDGVMVRQQVIGQNGDWPE